MTAYYNPVQCGHAVCGVQKAEYATKSETRYKGLKAAYGNIMKGLDVDGTVFLGERCRIVELEGGESELLEDFSNCPLFTGECLFSS